MPPTTRASARRASGAPTPPRPTPFWQESQPQPRAASPILGGTTNSFIAPSPDQSAGVTTRASAPRASAASQLVAADGSTRQYQTTIGLGSPIIGRRGDDDVFTALTKEIDIHAHENSQEVEAAGEDVIMIDSLPPRAPSPVLGGAFVPNNSLSSASSSSQPTSSSTHPFTHPVNSSQVLAAQVSVYLPPTVPISLRSNQTFAPPNLRTVIDSVNARCSPILSSQLVSSPSPRICAETMHRGNTVSPKIDYIILTTTDTFHKDLNDPYLRNLVGLLQHNHPWAPAKLCHSMLVGCRNYEDASDALLKFAIEIPDEEGNVNKQIARGKGKAPAQLSFTRSFNGSKLPTIDSSFFSKISNSRAPASGASLSSKPKGQTQAETKLILENFFKPPQSQGIFSRAERQRAIAASSEAAADRDRAAFVANAVLYRAFSYLNHNYGRVAQNYSPRFNIINFSMTSGLFPQSSKYVPSKQTHKGTDRGKFQPLTFNTPGDEIVVLQSISLAFPYVKTSFEELRFGDYIRGRKKAPHLFEPFRKLPPEIRCMVWRFSMTPRTVELRHDYNMAKCWTVSKIPVSLTICRESRYEALKVYTLSFRTKANPPKIYFDFKQDTLFLTFEKWHGEGDYEGGIDDLTDQLVRNGEAKKIRSLAMDRELVEIFANRLEEEEEEWYADGDEDMPMPELDVIPAYTSLQSLAIVKVAIDGFWEHDKLSCDCNGSEEDCTILKRAKKNDNAIFVSTHPYNVANKTQQEYYKQLVAQLKSQDENWNVPELGYMVKRKQLSKSGNKSPRRTCACGDCYPDSD